MDTGPIYTSIAIPIEENMRSLELLEKLSHVGVQAIKDALIAIENGVSPTPQTGAVSLAAKITRDEARLNWNASPETLVNKIRAFYPQPQAWTMFRGQPLKIAQAIKIDTEVRLEPGELRILGLDCYIGTLGNAIVLERVTPAGKKEMSALDWSRGARFESAERCG
jgi:methionyl-tRNA formyltransferase